MDQGELNDKNGKSSAFAELFSLLFSRLRGKNYALFLRAMGEGWAFLCNTYAKNGYKREKKASDGMPFELINYSSLSSLVWGASSSRALPRKVPKKPLKPLLRKPVEEEPVGRMVVPEETGVSSLGSSRLG